MNDLVKVKECMCGYVAFCDISDFDTKCICGKFLDMYNEYDATMTFEVYKQFYEKNNSIIEKDNNIMKSIVDLWNQFTELEQTHPNDKEDFCKAIHDLQSIMGMRELRRLMPEKYPTKE